MGVCTYQKMTGMILLSLGTYGLAVTVSRLCLWCVLTFAVFLSFVVGDIIMRD